MKKYVRASYTVEAAFLMPILIFLTAFVMTQALEMYRETSEKLGEMGETCVTEPVTTVRRLKHAKEIAGDLEWK